MESAFPKLSIRKFLKLSMCRWREIWFWNNAYETQWIFSDHFFQIYSYLSQRILHRENFVSKLWSSREVRRKRNNRDSRRVKNIWGLERSRRKQTGRSFVLVLYIVVFFFVLRNNDVSESVRCDQSHSWSRRLQRRWVNYFK